MRSWDPTVPTMHAPIRVAQCPHCTRVYEAAVQYCPYCETPTRLRAPWSLTDVPQEPEHRVNP